MEKIYLFRSFLLIAQFLVGTIWEGTHKSELNCLVDLNFETDGHTYLGISRYFVDCVKGVSNLRFLIHSLFGIIGRNGFSIYFGT